jgi:hypothetical protein
MTNLNKNKKFWIVSVTFIMVSLGFLIFYISQHKHNESIKYALLIGGGLCEIDNYNTFYKNIEYASNSLNRLGYNDNNVKILFYGGRSSSYPLIEADATRGNVIAELMIYKRIIDQNDTLLIFRAGHGMIELVDENYGILSNNNEVPESINTNIIGTVAVMSFPDGPLSYLDFQELLERIKARQIIVILSQCYSGQFTEITTKLANTVVVSETGEVGIAFSTKQRVEIWNHEVWPFVKCIFDGFLLNGCCEMKGSVFKAFEYMLSCNPNVEGISVKADRPLLRETPQIKYGKGLTKGAVYID